MTTPRHLKCGGGLLASLGLAIAAIGSVPLFESSEPVEFTLEFSLKELRGQRVPNEPYDVLGKAIWQGHEIELEVRARGHNRRRKATCKFPPYRINFKRKQTEGTVFEGINKIKVVSHCREGWTSFDPYIHREYLTYQTYRLITDHSFRVRLARIHYVDADSGEPALTATAFFIEPMDVLEERLQAREVKDRYITPSRYEPADLALAEFFQFFVGNSDFSYFASDSECCHNGKAMAPDDGGKLIPIPYDYDMAGIVNAPYAHVQPGLPIERVTERYYRGTRKPEALFRATVDHYLARKADILTLWSETELLPPKYRKHSVAFIEDFFAILEDPKRLDEEIIRWTRNPSAVERSVEERKAEVANDEG
jgi:hypothetical protein